MGGDDVEDRPVRPGGALAAGRLPDDDDCIDCPPADLPPEPTLANIWPHAEGTQWVYDFDFNQYAGPDLTDPPPPLPSLADLHAALQLPIPTDLIEADEGPTVCDSRGN